MNNSFVSSGAPTPLHVFALRAWGVFLTLVALAGMSACANYPTIPKIEETPGASDQAPPEGQESIGEIFQKKASQLIAAPDKTQKDYQIGPEDVLHILVWDHKDLTRDVCVGQQGEFSYPLIGTVMAEGLTVAQLEKHLRDRLSGRYIVNPQVTVTVKEYKSKKVFLLGEVGGTPGGQGPGTYPLTGKTTLLEILSLAGGPGKEAGSEVLVIRPKVKTNSPLTPEKASKDETLSVNLRSLLDGDASQNIVLQPNDTIYVSRADYFFVFGEVKKPGRYNLEKGTTVLKAITIAGGVTEIAAINKTKVVREHAGTKTETPVKMNDPVQPEDIVMVPQSFF